MVEAIIVNGCPGEVKSAFVPLFFQGMEELVEEIIFPVL